MAYLIRTLALVIAFSCIISAQNQTAESTVPANGTEPLGNGTQPTIPPSSSQVPQNGNDTNVANITDPTTTSTTTTTTTTMLPMSNATLPQNGSTTAAPATTTAPGGAASVISSVSLMVFAVILCSA